MKKVYPNDDSCYFDVNGEVKQQFTIAATSVKYNKSEIFRAFVLAFSSNSEKFLELIGLPKKE